MAILAAPQRLTVVQPTSAETYWEPFSNGASNLLVTYSNEVLISGTNSVVVGRAYHNSVPSFAGATQIGAQTVISTATSTPVTLTFSLAGVPATDYVAGFVGANTPGNTIEIDLEVEDDAVNCAYGTKVNPSTPYLIQLLPEAFVVFVGAVSDGWALPLAALFVGRYLDVTSLCALPRPAPPVISQQDVVDALAFPPGPRSIPAIALCWQWIQWAAWPQYCICVPGSPPAISYPPISQLAPYGVQPGPPAAITCDGADLCTQIQFLANAIASLAGAQQSMMNLVTLIQRQHVPFAYVPGTLHTGLSGTGTIIISNVLGLSIQTTSLPGYLSSDMAPVASWFKLGEVSWGTADGWQARRIVTHNPHLFLDMDADLTTVGYEFEPDVVANILELVRES